MIELIIDFLVFCKLMDPRPVPLKDRIEHELEETRFAILKRATQLEDIAGEMIALQARESRLRDALDKGTSNVVHLPQAGDFYKVLAQKSRQKRQA
jgi:hypothetical protein